MISDHLEKPAALQNSWRTCFHAAQIISNESVRVRLVKNTWSLLFIQAAFES